jgi:hypothetical protein
MAFKKGESGNPQGRPAGMTSGAKLRKSIETKSTAILKTVIQAAIEGDINACKILLDRICPVLKPQAIAVTVPQGGTLADSGSNILAAALGGSIPTDAAAQLIGALANQGKLIELQELTLRIEQIEDSLGNRK